MSGWFRRALIARAKTGEGRAIATSLFESMADWMMVPLLHFDYGGTIVPRVGLNHPTIHPYGAYETNGGAPVLIAIQNEREFGRLAAEVLGRPDLPADPRFATNVARCGNRAALDAVINGVFGVVQRGDLLARLKQAQIAFGEVNDVAGLSRHPALRRSDVNTPTGPAAIVAPPARTGTGPAFRPVPALGQHTEAIRKEFA